MRNLKKFLIIAISLGALSACDSAGSGVSVQMPDASVQCTSSKCNAAAGIHNATVTLTKSGCAPDQIDFYTVAVGAASAICGTTGCTATVSSWTDKPGDPLTEIESASYSLCGWIDLDDNGQKNSSADAFSENTKYVTGSTLDLTDWSVTYSSIRLRPHR